MKKPSTVFLTTLIFLFIAGCTMDVAAPVPPTIVPSPTPFEQPNLTDPPSAQLVANGRLVYTTVAIDAGVYVNRIQLLDIATSRNETIFSVSGNAWIYYLTASPNAEKIILAYAPLSPPGPESPTGLYVLPLGGSESPTALITPETAFDGYVQVEWSPDGKTLYFVHLNTIQAPDESYPHYEIFRIAYPDGQPEKIIDQGFWPRVSADSSRLVYVSLDAVTGSNSLFVANADGTNAQQIVMTGPMASVILDAPAFLPNGNSILFSAPPPPQSYRPGWLDRLMGVQTALAHNVPSDWWSVPITGGEATRLTKLQTIKLFADFSPDNSQIASVNGDGIFIMDVDGSNLTRVVFDPGVSGVVNWIP